jgi:bifunctional non-homologous end joining protein LigD
LIALGEDGRPSFNALQNGASSHTPILYYLFDVMVLGGRSVKAETLETRRTLLERHVLPKLSEPARYTGELQVSLRDLIHSVKAQGLEGLVAKRRDSHHEPGRRSGAWMKMRVNRGLEFVIGDYTIGTSTFDALVFGYYEGDRLIYAARTRNGFTPILRQQWFKRFHGLAVPDCPFANLPEAKSGRWGQGLTRAKMAECRWLKPVLVGQFFEFLEWSGEHHLRHTKFIGLREDKSGAGCQTGVGESGGRCFIHSRNSRLAVRPLEQTIANVDRSRLKISAGHAQWWCITAAQQFRSSKPF